MTKVQLSEAGDEIRFTVSEPEFDKFASDALRRLRDKQEEHLEEALKGLGWTSPDDLPALKRKIAAKALREAADELGRQPLPCGSPGCHESDLLVVRRRADRIEQGGQE